MKYIVEVPHQRYDGILYDVERYTSLLYLEVMVWLHEEVGIRDDTWSWPDRDKFMFLNELDAMAFKLRWV